MQNLSAQADTGHTSRPLAALGIALALTLTSCATQSYEPEPLAADLIQSISAERLGTASRDTAAELLTLARAVSWLRTSGPRVREAIAAYHTALAKAGIATPWPNPGVEVGPEFGFGSDVDVNEVVPFGSLSIAIPLSGRLARQDDLNAAVAEQIRIEALATFRELYLSLRAHLLHLTVARQRELLREALLESTRISLGTGTDLVEAGTATALDVSLLRLENARERSRRLQARLETANAAADLAELVAVSSSRLLTLQPMALPQLPTELPTFNHLQELIERENPRLVRLRAEYEVAERSLHLEVTKQYPDLTFGPSLGGESGERKTALGLSLGIELPLFDRNQQAIAQARKLREEIRTRYESEAHRVITAVERSLETVAITTERSAVLREDVLPVATRNVEIARQSLSAGSTGGLQVLDAQRSSREVQIEVLQAQLAEQIAWSDLERAVGFPLVQFHSDPDWEGLQPPNELQRESANPDGDED